LTQLRLRSPPVSRGLRPSCFPQALKHFEGSLPSLAVGFDSPLNPLMSILRQFSKQLHQSRFDVFSRLGNRLNRAFEPFELLHRPVLSPQMAGRVHSEDESENHQKPKFAYWFQHKHLPRIWPVAAPPC
jgi:hypothetical protein